MHACLYVPTYPTIPERMFLLPCHTDSHTDSHPLVQMTRQPYCVAQHNFRRATPKPSPYNNVSSHIWPDYDTNQQPVDTTRPQHVVSLGYREYPLLQNRVVHPFRKMSRKALKSISRDIMEFKEWWSRVKEWRVAIGIISVASEIPAVGCVYIYWVEIVTFWASPCSTLLILLYGLILLLLQQWPRRKAPSLPSPDSFNPLYLLLLLCYVEVPHLLPLLPNCLILLLVPLLPLLPFLPLIFISPLSVLYRCYATTTTSNIATSTTAATAATTPPSRVAALAKCHTPCLCRHRRYPSPQLKRRRHATIVISLPPGQAGHAAPTGSCGAAVIAGRQMARVAGRRGFLDVNMIYAPWFCMGALIAGRYYIWNA